MPEIFGSTIFKEIIFLKKSAGLKRDQVLPYNGRDNVTGTLSEPIATAKAVRV